MRLGVLGCGSIGTRHVGNLLALGVQASDIAVYDPDPSAVARLTTRHPGLALGSTATSAPYDAALICSPAKHHLVQVENLLKNRMPFMVEKPVAEQASLRLAALVLQAETVPHLVGYNLLFHSGFAALQRSKPSSVLLSCLCDMRQWTGSAYGDWLPEMSHELHGALALGATSVEYATMAGDVLTVRFAGRPLVTVRLSAKASAYQRCWTGDGVVYGKFASGAALGNEMYVDELRHFLAVVRGEERSRCTLRDGLRVLQTIDQIRGMAVTA